jgi:hypothetical protein
MLCQVITNCSHHELIVDSISKESSDCRLIAENQGVFSYPDFLTSNISGYFLTLTDLFFCLIIIIIIIIIMAQQPFMELWPLFQFLDPIHSRQDPLDGGSARRKASTHTQNNTNTE